MAKLALKAKLTILNAKLDVNDLGVSWINNDLTASVKCIISVPKQGE